MGKIINGKLGSTTNAVAQIQDRTNDYLESKRTAKQKEAAKENQFNKRFEVAKGIKKGVAIGSQGTSKLSSLFK